MGIALSQPVEVTRVQRTGTPSFKAAVAEMQGWRQSHEDAHDMTCGDRWGSFWVLDGHGGEKASEFCAPELSNMSSQGLREDAQLPDDARIGKAFEEVDELCKKHLTNENDQSGSTVVGALILKGQDGTYSVKICNCGDSRGLVIAPPTEEASPPAKLGVKRPSHLIEDPPAWPVITASIDHKPDYPTEKERIEKAGGTVIADDACARLDGNLAVSRGLGDFEFKQGKLPAAEQKVSCLPDIYEVDGLKEGSVCVLACDGLWDVFNDDEVAAFVRKHLQEHPKADLGVLCAHLVHDALKKDSRDNITVMIIQMVDGSDWSVNSGRFNKSDEMMYFDKMLDDTLDDCVRSHYTSFLKRCKFPSDPIQCAGSGRWFGSMFQCPGTGNVYMSRHYQKKGWAKFKKIGGQVGVDNAKSHTLTEDEAW